MTQLQAWGKVSLVFRLKEENQTFNLRGLKYLKSGPCSSDPASQSDTNHFPSCSSWSCSFPTDLLCRFSICIIFYYQRISTELLLAIVYLVLHKIKVSMPHNIPVEHQSPAWLYWAASEVGNSVPYQVLKDNFVFKGQVECLSSGTGSWAGSRGSLKWCSHPSWAEGAL